MSDGNGNGNSRILLHDRQPPKQQLTRAQRAEVEKLAYDMIIQECAKVHEHYLAQIPAHVARMIQDALLDYQLTKIVLGDDNVPIIVAHTDPRPEWQRPIAPPDAAPGPETPPTPAEGDEVGNAP